MSSFKINKTIISDDSPPYLIAEIGVNHEGSYDNAKMLIELAKEGGANAAKFQSYKAETIASENSPSYWDTSKESSTSQFKLFKKYDKFDPDDYIKLSEHCKKCEIDFLSTPFDNHSINYLEPIMPAYKVASADITNYPFLKKISEKKKPVILSTGASTLSEINSAKKILENSSRNSIALLHCILNYPTENANAHLSMIKGLKRTYPNTVIGYSDHTVPNKDMSSLIISYTLGARIIEKHFTHDKTLKGNDHYHAMDINDLKVFNLKLREVMELLGTSDKKPIESEIVSIKNARRSIVISKKVHKDQEITEDYLTYKRPGTGISPVEWTNVIGKHAKNDLEEDHILNWEDLK